MANGCNACLGKGRRTVWPTQWKDHPGDIVPVADLLARWDPEKHAPYALVTLDGQWHARGKMGWFGVGTESDDGKPAWDALVKQLLEQDRAAVAVVVDCHI